MKNKLISLLLIFLAGSVSAIDYYVDNDLTDINVASATPDCANYNPTAGVCGGGTASAFKSLRDVNALINSFSGTTQNNIYFQRGDVWIFTSDSDRIIITRSNVTLDAFGSGNKPVLDGQNQYPTGVTSNDVPYRAAIHVGEDLLSTHDVWIKNLRIQNMYPGLGITFKGIESEGGAYYEGGGGVVGCEISHIGWAAITLHNLPLVNGRDPIKIEKNYLNKIGEYRKDQGVTMGGWPQAISANNGFTYGHECNYNIIEDCYTEGIGATGFDIVEYNLVSDTHSPSIYLGSSKNIDPLKTPKFNTVIRYNLIWGDTDGSYGGGEIRFDDETEQGDNAGLSHEIYGNIIIGGFACINLRNNPLDGTTWSPIGNVSVYNNLCIDNQQSIVAAYSNRFNHVEIKNNAFIINPDSESACKHLAHWTKAGETEDWSGWTWGPNYWYGDTADTQGGMWSMPFYNISRDATSSTAPLPKTSGWRSLTSLNNFSFADLTPQETSALVNNLKAEILSGYDQYLTTGTNFSKLPENPTFVLADQDSEGDDWDFGAVVHDFGGTQTCNYPADYDHSCKIERGELDNYVNLWKSNSGISLSQMIEVIGKWKSGGGL